MTPEGPRLRRTPLHDLHVGLGGRMTGFAGWEMPVQFPAGIVAEHRQCRERAALFDVSHMGQIELHGNDAARKLESLAPADISSLKTGKARYTFLTDDSGGILDDLIVANTGDRLFAVVNAATREQDVLHLRNRLGGIEVKEITDRALVAVQGPKAEDVVGALCRAAHDLRFMETAATDVMGTECRVSRMGYTGEDGYEISIPRNRADEIARALLAHPDCEPAGLGARDSLRLEAGLCLYGSDMDCDTSPIEANLLWAIPPRRRERGGFPGAGRILREISEGPSRKLVGIRPEGRAPVRSGVEIRDESGDVLGKITSGGFGPTVGGPVAMGYVAISHARPGTRVYPILRGKVRPATVVDLPFVRRNYKR